MVLALLFLTLAGIIFMVLGWQGWRGRLPRNPWAGIRTPFAMSSDDAWRAVHRNAAPILIFGGVAVVAAGLALVPFAAVGALPADFEAIVALAMVGLLLGAVAVAWLIGTRKAKAELSGHDGAPASGSGTIRR